MSVKERSHNYEQAFRALQERLASGDTEEAIKSYGEQLLKQIGQSKQLGHFSLDALTSVLCELNQTITTQTLTHAIDCLHYYEMRLALDDTLSMQPKNELIRVSGKSILEQIIRLKASPRFPLIELWQVLVIIDGAINAQNRNNHAVVNLIHYYKARLALQESLSKQRIINTLKRGAEALLRQITQLQRSAALSLDELTESLEAVNAIINLPTGIGDQAMDCLHYEQARLMLRTTLTDPKTVPLLISYGESVLEKTEQVKASPQRGIALYELTKVLELSHQAIKAPTVLNAKACLNHSLKIAPRTNRILYGALLGLFGAVVLVASVAAALVSFGVASPVSLVAFEFGVSLIIQAVSIGSAVLGASVVGASLFSLFKPKPLPEQLKAEIANMSQQVAALRGG